jgi:hypothetical protein
VHVHPKWVEATDNVQLCRWRVKTNVKSAFLVMKESVKHVASLGMTEISETENWVHFRNNSKLVLSCRRFVEEYPNITPLLSVEGAAFTIPPGLEEAIEKAIIFSKENPEANHVQVELRPDRISITGEGASGGYTKTRKVSYSGPAMSFHIAPQVLNDLVTKHSSCVLASDRIKVDGGHYDYLTLLRKPKEVEKPETEE